MSTFFDLVTVACFVALVVGFVRFTERDTATLMRFVLSGVVLAIANQLGNQGHMVFGCILILGAMAFGWLSLGKPGDAP